MTKTETGIAHRGSRSSRFPHLAIATLLILFLASPAVARAQRSGAETATSPGKPLRTLPLKRKLGTVVVPVRVNGRQTIDCILDTGMPEGLFLMDRKTAEHCELSAAGTANVAGGGSGTLAAQVYAGTTLRLADLEFSNQRVIAVNEPGPLAHLGVEGVIGASVFSKYIVEMDFDRQQLKLYSPDAFDASEAGESFALEIVNTKPFLKGVVQVDDRKEVPVTLLLDTGANKGLTLNPAANPLLAPSEKSLKSLLGSGVGGDINGSRGRTRFLRLGNYQLDHVTTGFPDLSGIDRDGTLGMEVLQRFVATIDYPNQRLLLRPGKSYDQPFEFNMTGVSARPDPHGVLVVRSVLENSPAAEADIRIGDTVLAVGGQPVTFADYVRISRDFTEPGKTVVFVMERDGRQYEKSLVLRRQL